MPNHNIIPLFFSVDDLYAPYLAVAIQSIKENASNDNQYHIHILVAAISEENKRRLSAMQDARIVIEFVDVRQQVLAMKEKLHLRDYYTLATYYRFFISEMFPQYTRGIYLDCDIVVTGDIAELYQVDTGDCILGAVTDEVVTHNEIFSRYTKTVVGVEAERYFNAGVLVMNLEKMRRLDLIGAFSRLLNLRQFPVAQDQDYLNILCFGDVHYIENTWNKTPFPDSPACTPKLIHFKLNFRPWRYTDVRFEEHFWRYAQHTAYAAELFRQRETYSAAEKERDAAQAAGLLALAKQETAKMLTVAQNAH